MTGSENAQAILTGSSSGMKYAELSSRGFEIEALVGFANSRQKHSCSVLNAFARLAAKFEWLRNFDAISLGVVFTKSREVDGGKKTLFIYSGLLNEVVVDWVV